MARRRRTRQHTERIEQRDHLAAELQEEIFEPELKGAGKASWRVRGILFLVGLAALIWFLPAIVANTPLKQFALNHALGGFRGNVTVDSMSVGWMSPIELKGIQAIDATGEPLATIESMTTSKSLFGLIGTSDFGTITITGADVNFQVRHEGSNLEDAIAAWLEAPSDPAAPMPRVQVTLEDSVLQVVDAATGETSQFKNVAATIALPSDEGPFKATISAQSISSNASGTIPSGLVTGTLVTDEGESALTFSRGRIELDANAQELLVATPFLKRFVEPMRVSGRLDGRLVVRWRDWGESLSVDAHPAKLQGVRLSVPKRLGDDPIRVDDGWLQGRLAMDARGLQAKSLDCRTEFASVKADGELAWAQLNDISAAEIPAADFHSEGTLDVARLAMMLPNTVPVHKDVTLESGVLQFSANTRPDGNSRRLVVNAESSGVTALRAGNRISWNKPVRLAAAIRQGSTGTTMESFECTTNFLKVVGSANSESGEVTVNGDLGNAMAELEQFVDLSGVQIRGAVDGRFTWQFGLAEEGTSMERPLRAGGELQIRNPGVTLPGQTEWSQSELNLVVGAAGQLTKAGSAEQTIRLDSGSLELRNANQRLKATLLQPVSNPGLASQWDLQCELQGDANVWLAQLATFLPVQAQVEGQLNGNAAVRWNGEQLVVSNGQCQATDFKFHGYGLAINEPSVEVAADARIDLTTQSLEAGPTTLRSSAIAARGENVTVDFSSGATTGQIAFRADVNRAMAWLGPPSPESIQYFGSAEGSFDLQANAEGVGGRVEVRIQDLVAARQVPESGSQVRNASAQQWRWDRLLEEKQVVFASQLQADPAFQSVTFESLTLDSSAARLQANGAVSDLAGECHIDARGDWAPNWQALEPLMREYAGDMVTLNGVQGGAFAIRGPLFDATNAEGLISSRLTAETATRFDSGTLLGLPVGGSPVRVTLQNGVAQIQTEPMAFSGGTLNLSPSVDLRGPVAVVSAPAGTVLNNVQLTPEICRGWLRYVTPVLADATAAQGRFSMSVQGLRIPMDVPSSASVNGTLTLHGATVGPGPLGLQMIQTAKQLKALARGQALDTLLGGGGSPSGGDWVAMPEQSIPFALDRGRIVHQGMQFQVDDVLVRTQGAVGLDQSLELMATIPVLDKWIGDNRWFAGLRGQAIQVPVTGSVSRPRVDSSVIAQLSTQMARGAATNAINQEVQGLIDKGNEKLQNELMKGIGSLFGNDKK